MKNVQTYLRISYPSIAAHLWQKTKKIFFKNNYHHSERIYITTKYQFNFFSF